MSKDGGPAFPVSTASDSSGVLGHQDGHYTWQYPGMSLRDYFATHIPLHADEGVPATFAENFAIEVTGTTGRGGRRPLSNEEVALMEAKWRYVVADAMLKAREP